MSEFGGLWKYENNQHALVSPKTECGCPSGGGIKNDHIGYPSYGGTQKLRKKELTDFPTLEVWTDTTVLNLRLLAAFEKHFAEFGSVPPLLP